MKYLLDTSILIDYFREKDHAVRTLTGLTGELFSSYVCMGELMEGVYRSKKSLEWQKKILSFFKEISGLYGIDQEIAFSFGSIRAKLSAQGKIIGDIDTIIAATCVSYDLTLVTLNKKHFERIPKLRLLR